MDRLEARLSDLVRSNLTGQALIDAVRAIDNSTADTLRDVIDAKEPLPHDQRRILIGVLAGKAEPKWAEWQFEWVQEFKDPNGRIQREMTGFRRMAAADVP